MICYDREYPESARILMLKGAEVLLVPNDCGSMQPKIRALLTRAYEKFDWELTADLMTFIVLRDIPKAKGYSDRGTIYERNGVAAFGEKEKKAEAYSALQWIF